MVMKLSLCPSPSPHLQSDIGNQQLQQPIYSCENQKPSRHLKQKRFTAFQKTPSPENCHYFISLGDSWERSIYMQGFLQFDSPQNLIQWNIPYLRLCVTKIKIKKKDNQQLLNTAAAQEGNTSWGKQETDQIFKRKIQGMRQPQ